MFVSDFFLRLPPAAAVLVLSAIFQTADADPNALPLETKTVELRELDVLPWPPVATIAPRYPPVLLARQFNTVCGFIAGDPDLPATCSAGSHCAADVEHGAIGCCPNDGPCTQGVFTGCVDANSGPQTVLDPYVFTCSGSNVCYQNQFDGGFFQWGCGSSSRLATDVAASAPGQSIPELVSLSVAFTVEPTTLSEPTTIFTVTSERSSATSDISSTETDETSSSRRTTSSGTSSETETTSSQSSSSQASESETSTATTTGPNSSNTADPNDGDAPAADGKDSDKTAAIIGGTLGGVAGAALIVVLAALLWRRRRRGNTRQGPGPNQSPEFIKSPIDSSHGPNFTPLPLQSKSAMQMNTPRDQPMAFAHPGDRISAYDNTISSPYAGAYTQRDSDEYSHGYDHSPAVALGHPGRGLEQDEIPLTRDADPYQQPYAQPAAPAQPLYQQHIDNRLDNIQEEDTESNAPVSAMSAYPPRSADGSGALWHQNRRTRNPTWM